MDEQKQNKIILKILVKQALIQQYLININVCCLLNDYFYTIALNGLAIIFIAFVYHIIPLKSSKIKYIVEYSLLAGVQILAIFMKELLIYLASSLLGLSILSVLFKICRTQLNVDQSLGLFKLLKVCRNVEMFFKFAAFIFITASKFCITMELDVDICYIVVYFSLWFTFLNLYDFEFIVQNFEKIELFN
ncbi:unnamed protein product [Paramecium pentaurelia]|uniref:Transmembrane protein n=1 Tax=Paramecium pentaurelia TaxID=43138 RepID=A0A8S1W936_9CILI|nr:unnamed protein product [Paramecium pentaurelia]